jgi:hypothetical protein
MHAFSRSEKNKDYFHGQQLRLRGTPWFSFDLIGSRFLTSWIAIVLVYDAFIKAMMQLVLLSKQKNELMHGGYCYTRLVQQRYKRPMTR